jgi:hypothetical protein
VPAFISTQVSVAVNTPVKIVDAEEFDRVVSVLDPVTGMRVAFTSADASTGFQVRNLGLVGTAMGTFVLPADHEAWVYSSAATTAEVFVTSIAR